MAFVQETDGGRVERVRPNYGAQTPGGVSTGQTGAGQSNTGGADPGQSSGVIPGAGVYLQQQNNAEKAYQQAQTQLLTKRNTLYHQYGLTADGSVDPNNQYGGYQVLLGNEGAALDSARNEASGRHLGGGGLANQGESSLRNQQALEQLNFQQGVDSIQGDYGQGMTAAELARSQAFTQAEQDQANWALLNGAFNTPANPGDSNNDGVPNETPSQVPSTVKRKLAVQQAKSPDNRGGAKGVNGTLYKKPTTNLLYKGRH